jgi:hypothetical protein
MLFFQINGIDSLRFSIGNPVVRELEDSRGILSDIQGMESGIIQDPQSRGRLVFLLETPQLISFNFLVLIGSH